MHELNTAWPEARYRIKTPNSQPRQIRVICLSDADVDVELCRKAGDAPNVAFTGPGDFASKTGLRADQALDRHLNEAAHERVQLWLGTPDLVIICGAEDNDPTLGVLAAKAYRSRPHPVNITGFVRATVGTSVSDTLRPLCSMMSLVTGAGYLAGLLDALGAQP